MSESLSDEFREIGHSGGKITFTFASDGFQTEFVTSRPVPSVMIALYALPPGLPVAEIHLGGIGDQWNPPPYRECIPVFVGSDEQGHFGHHCPACKGYWRSNAWPNVCPYCCIRAKSYQFLSNAQRRYVMNYCQLLLHSNAEEGASFVIDMDEVADAVGKDGVKPAFYVSEKSQQHKFTCESCDEFNDVLGRFAYCSNCGTRNDLSIYQNETIPHIRALLNAGAVPADTLKDAVSSFDSFIAQYAHQLVQKVPMTETRKHRLVTERFHNLDKVRTTFNDWFDIDPCRGMKEDERNFVGRMFYRRHVYEHNGGEVTQKYLNDSGDSSVVLKQHIRETKEDLHKLLGSLTSMARNIHGGFHELIPPIAEKAKALP